VKPVRQSAAERVESLAAPVFETAQTGLPALEQCLVVVSGLPRSGTSLLMQML
jgi:hypothetical protein